jgi:hypothetical protein
MDLSLEEDIKEEKFWIDKIEAGLQKSSREHCLKRVLNIKDLSPMDKKLIEVMEKDQLIKYLMNRIKKDTMYHKPHL